MINNAPPLLVVLLATVVMARIGIVFVVGSPLSTALGWAGLLGALGLAALYRQQWAATALGYLCMVLGIDTLVQLWLARVTGVHLLAALTWASLVLGVGAFVLRSAQVRRFYASAK